MPKSQRAYFGLSWIISVILAIFFAWPLGIVVRLMRGSLLMAILNIFLGPIFWVVDVVSIIVNKDITWLS